MRQVRYSSRVIHSRASNLRVSQPAMPTWSGCMCVTNTRVMRLPAERVFGERAARVQLASASRVCAPVSTMAQPPSSASA